MTLTADNVRVGSADGATGGVYSAPDGTAIPTNATDALNGAFVQLGYLSEDGVTQAINQDITEIKAWQGGAVVRKVQTRHDLTYAFTMIETSDDTLEEYYGNFDGGSVEVNGDQLPHKRYLIAVKDGLDIIRVVIPDGQVLERGDVVYKNDEAVGYSVTVTAFPDADGVKAYIYLGGPDS